MELPALNSASFSTNKDFPFHLSMSSLPLTFTQRQNNFCVCSSASSQASAQMTCGRPTLSSVAATWRLSNCTRNCWPETRGSSASYGWDKHQKIEITSKYTACGALQKRKKIEIIIEPKVNLEFIHRIWTVWILALVFDLVLVLVFCWKYILVDYRRTQRIPFYMCIRLRVCVWCVCIHLCMYVYVCLCNR